MDKEGFNRGAGFVRVVDTELNEHYSAASCQQDGDVELRVACVARQKSAGLFRTERSSIPIHVMEYVLSGEGVFASEGRSYDLSPGMVFVYGGDTPHRYHNLPGVPFERYYIGLDGRRAKEALLDCAGTASGALGLAETADVLASFESVLKVARGNGEFAGELALNYLRNLLLFVKRNLARPGDAREVTAREGSFLRARKEIDDHYLELGSLAEVAARLGLSEHYVCRLFKRYGGRTPYQYLTERKMACASSLLLTSPKSIKEIAGLLGFADVYSFSRVFKKTTGEPPGRLRARRP